MFMLVAITNALSKVFSLALLFSNPTQLTRRRPKAFLYADTPVSPHNFMFKVGLVNIGLAGYNKIVGHLQCKGFCNLLPKHIPQLLFVLSLFFSTESLKKMQSIIYQNLRVLAY